MTTQTRTIRIVVDTKNAKGLKALASQFGTMNRRVKSASSNLSTLTRSFQGLIAGFGIREVIKSADSFQLLKDRIKVFTGSADQANKVFTDIASLARKTRSSIENFAEGYNRVAIATQGLGLSSDQTLGVVTALQQSLRISGASAQEASSVFIQLSQALSLGRLQGQELRAVLLSNATVANLLAKEFGVTTGQLKELGEQGKLTSDRVIKALADNFELLNEKASNLGTTFGQTLIILFDQFRIQVDKLNSTFSLNSNFFKGMSFLIENMSTLLKVTTTLVTSAILLKLGAQIQTLGATISSAGGIVAFAKSLSFAGLAVKGLVIAFALLTTEALSNWDRFVLTLKLGSLKINQAVTTARGGLISFFKTLAIGGKLNPFGRILEGAKIANDLSLDKLKKEIGGVGNELLKLKEKDSKSDIQGLIDRINKSFSSFKGSTAGGATGAIASLNKEFANGVIDIQLYREELDEINLNKLNESFVAGKITVDQYNKSILALKDSFVALSAGDQILTGISAGLSQAQQQIGSISQEVAGATTRSFNQLEDRLLAFVKTGKFEFGQFAQFVADELTKVAIRTAVLKPLLQSFGFGDSVTANANGNAFVGGKIQPFAKGGVVNSPTVFPFADGIGLMGEAGAEAILPLQRGPGGELGVRSQGGGTVVNIINNSSGQVEKRESEGPNGEKQIDVLIIDRVKKAIGEGKLDRTMSSTYGLQRRGV